MDLRFDRRDAHSCCVCPSPIGSCLSTSKTNLDLSLITIKNVIVEEGLCSLEIF